MLVAIENKSHVNFKTATKTNMKYDTRTKKAPEGIISLLFIICFHCISSCKENYKVVPSFISHPNYSSKKVEYYIKKPIGEGPHPAIIFIHGHQTGSKPGGRDFVDWGVLEEFSNRGFVAVAISQPGYGASDGPPDYCGTFTQNAVIAVIEKLENEGLIKPDKIILEGISRGAIVAGLVAAKKQTIKGVILISGVFDFIKYQEYAKTDGAKKSIMNSIHEEIGNSKDSLNSRSVINFTERITANTIILNGENDEKTVPQQAKELANEINKHGGSASFVIFKNSGHNIPVGKRNKIIDKFISKTFDEIKK